MREYFSPSPLLSTSAVRLVQGVLHIAGQNFPHAVPGLSLGHYLSKDYLPGLIRVDGSFYILRWNGTGITIPFEHWWWQEDGLVGLTQQPHPVHPFRYAYSYQYGERTYYHFIEILEDCVVGGYEYKEGSWPYVVVM
jgi:hypothetical protein